MQVKLIHLRTIPLGQLQIVENFTETVVMNRGKERINVEPARILA